MSQQGDEFVRRVLKADPDRGQTFGDVVQYFRQRGGSGRGAARLAGVSESTFRRWAAGTPPKAATVQRVTEAFRTLRSAPSRMGDAGVLLPVVSQDRKRGERTREITGKQLQLEPGTLAAAHAVWVKTGNSDKALARFLQGIGNPWYRAQLGAGAARAGAGGGGGGGGGGGDDDDDEEEGEDYEVSDYEGDFDEYVLDDDYGMSIG